MTQDGRGQPLAAAATVVNCIGEQTTVTGEGGIAAGVGNAPSVDLWPEQLEVLLGTGYTVNNDGVNGGKAAALNRFVVRDHTGEHQVPLVTKTTDVRVTKSDAVRLESPGGGGFGDPLERDPQLVLTDVMDEWLTVETARDYYGVAIDVDDAEALDYRIDEKKTAELRARLREKGFTEGLGSQQLHPKTRDNKLKWML